MSFYTNVQTIGNSILFRGVSNDGKRFKDRIEYHPTLYIPTKEETKFKTLQGEPVGEIRPGNMKECREFISKYHDIDNFDVYGNDKFEFSFIAEHFPEEHIDYDYSQIRIAYLDIETGSENGFPNVETAKDALKGAVQGKLPVQMKDGKFLPIEMNVTLKFDPNTQKLEILNRE